MIEHHLWCIKKKSIWNFKPSKKHFQNEHKLDKTQLATQDPT